MSRPKKLDDSAVTAWLAAHPGWARENDTLVATRKFPDYAGTIGFVVKLALAAEKRDHHPDLVVKWGSVAITWSTHDAGGISALDLELAEASDRLAGGT
jgi:4a-hydroxytetrahydrobiopterin dehydratase